MVSQRQQQQQQSSSWSPGSVLPPLGIPLRYSPLTAMRSHEQPEPHWAIVEARQRCTCCAQSIWARNASWYCEFTVIAETVRYLQGPILINDQSFGSQRIMEVGCLVVVAVTDATTSTQCYIWFFGFVFALHTHQGLIVYNSKTYKFMP